VLAWLRLARVFAKVDRASAQHLRHWGLSVAQFDVLAQVGAAEGLSQQELAAKLLVTKGNVTQLLDRMQRDGLIVRCQEGRTNCLFLTEKGRRLFDTIVPAQEALITARFAPLSGQEQLQLLKLLRRLDHTLG
jgi:DNA-binding MarR family transcriptional regulator